MLKLFCLGFLLFSLPALACLRAEGSFAVDGETHTFDLKIEPAKEYSLPFGSFILSFTLTGKQLKYKIEERKGPKLNLVSFGEEEDIPAKQSREIYAKGEEGHPNSIINFKYTEI